MENQKQMRGYLWGPQQCQNISLGCNRKNHQDPKQENRAQDQQPHSQLGLVLKEKLKNIWICD